MKDEEKEENEVKEENEEKEENEVKDEAEGQAENSTSYSLSPVREEGENQEEVGKASETMDEGVKEWRERFTREWSCPRCTFLNSDLRSPDKCEICDGARPLETRRDREKDPQRDDDSDEGEFFCSFFIPSIHQFTPPLLQL